MSAGARSSTPFGRRPISLNRLIGVSAIRVAISAIRVRVDFASREIDSDANSKWTLALAHWTKKRRAPGLHDALDDPAALRRRAVFAFAVVNPKIVLKQSKLAVGLLMVA